MKTLAFVFALMAILVMVPVVNAWYWTDEVNITNDTSYTDMGPMVSEHMVSVPQSSAYPVHVVWLKSENGDLYYKKQISDGNWSGVHHFPNCHISKYCWFSSATDPTGNYVYIVWMDESFTPHPQIAFNYSTDGGNTWLANPIYPWENTNYYYYMPDIAAASDGKVFVVWQRDWQDPPPHLIEFTYSTDYGQLWYAPVAINTPNAEDTWFPSIVTDPQGAFCHIVWLETYPGGGSETHASGTSQLQKYVSYRRYKFGDPNPWGNIITIRSDPIVQGQEYPPPNIACSKDGVRQNVHVVWSDWRDDPTGNKTEVYYKRSTNNGDNWLSDTRLSTLSSNYDEQATISTGDGNSNIVDFTYTNTDHSGNFQAWWRRSANGGASWASRVQLSSTGHNGGAFIADDCDNSTNVVFAKEIGGNKLDQYYKKYRPGNPPGFRSGLTDTRPYGGGIQVNPNPVTKVTQVSLILTGEGNRESTGNIYDIQGKLVCKLSFSKMDSGRASATWDGKDSSGRPVRNGVYFVSVQQCGVNQVGRIVVAK